MAQKLSPKAAKAKAKRDLAYAKTSSRKKKKAENQVKRREAAKKQGEHWLVNKDYDHTKKRFVSVAQNRGGYGKGTKNT
jgi:polyphosphate kinase 2 (PPK2 family)